MSFCRIKPNPVAAHIIPSDKPRTITSLWNIRFMISFVPSMFPYCRQFAAATLIINKAIPSQNKVKNPWKGDLTASAFCLSNAVNCRVKTKSLNLLRLLGNAESFSYRDKLNINLTSGTNQRTLSIPIFKISLNALLSSAVKTYRPGSFNLFRVTGIFFSLVDPGCDLEEGIFASLCCLPFMAASGVCTPLLSARNPPPFPPLTKAVGSCFNAS